MFMFIIIIVYKDVSFKNCVHYEDIFVELYDSIYLKLYLLVIYKYIIKYIIYFQILQLLQFTHFNCTHISQNIKHIQNKYIFILLLFFIIIFSVNIFEYTNNIIFI